MQGNRKEVNNPFNSYTAGTRPGGLIKHKADLQSRARSRSSYQAGDKGLMIVDSLVKFAGVGGDAYVQELSKKVEIDKIEQSARAMEGLAPSDTATLAGYKAHAALSIKNKAMKEQFKLNMLAVQGCTDEEWKKAKQSAYENLDTFMRDNYKVYDTDKDLQKLTVLTMREMMPQVTAKKMAEDTNREIQGRVDSATDSLINAAKTGGIYKLKTKDAIDKYNTMFKALKLTPKQADDAFYNAIKDTKDPKLIELSKQWTGAHKSSLYNRNAQIQKIDEQNKKLLNTTNAVKRAVEKRTLIADLVNGKSTEKQFLKIVDKKNQKSKGNFMGEAEIRAALNQRDKVIAKNHVKNNIISAISNPNKTDLSEYKKADVQNAYSDMFNVSLTKIKEDAEKLSEDKRTSYIQDKTVQLIQHLTDISVSKDIPVHAVLSDLHNLAQTNVPAVSETKSLKDVKGQVERLPEYVDRAYATLQAMSLGTREYYLNNLDKNDRNIIRKYMNLREMGIPNSQALIQAQAVVRNPTPYNAKVVKKNVDTVVSALNGWFTWNIPDKQKAYMENEIRNKITSTPMGDKDVEGVTKYFESHWTYIGDGLRIKGSSAALQRLTGLHPTRLKNAINCYVDSYKSKIKPILDSMGLETDDVFPITNPKTGIIQLATANGIIPGTTRSLSEIKDIANQEKVRKEKAEEEYYNKISESFNTFTENKVKKEVETKTQKKKKEEREYDKISEGFNTFPEYSSKDEDKKDSSDVKYEQQMLELNQESDKLKAETKARKEKQIATGNLFYKEQKPVTGVKVNAESAQKELLQDTMYFENSIKRGYIQGKFYPIVSSDKTPKSSPFSRYEIGYGLKVRKEWIGDDKSKWLKYNGVPVNLKKGITKEVAKGIARNMMKLAYKSAKKVITPKLWNKMSEQEKAFYADIDYNSGSGVKSSKKALSLINKGLNVEAMITELDFIHSGKKGLRGIAKRRITAYNKAALEKTGAPIVDGYKFGKQFKVHFSNAFHTSQISEKLAKKISQNNGWLVICNIDEEESDRIFKPDKHFKFKE